MEADPGISTLRPTIAIISNYDRLQKSAFSRSCPSPGPEVSLANTKIVYSIAEAVADIPNGAVVMLDGFAGPGGTPQNLIRALRDQGARDLTIISNTAGLASVIGFGTIPGDRPTDMGVLVDNEQIKKVIASFPVSPSSSRPTSFERAYGEGKVDLELVPQGTLAERIRAGGAGIRAFYTPTGVGTQMAEGKESREFDGRWYLLEHALTADFALLKGHKADTAGNLAYRGTSQNFNAVMATAAGTTVVEVDEVVQPDGLTAVDTPGIYVDRIVVP